MLESFGLAALEARCVGLPVVGRADSGLTDFVADGVEGLLAARTRDGRAPAAAGRRRRPAPGCPSTTGPSRPSMTWPQARCRRTTRRTPGRVGVRAPGLRCGRPGVARRVEPFTLRGLPRPSRRRGAADRRHAGPGRRRGAPGGARDRHRRRARGWPAPRTARATGWPARRWPSCEARRAALGCRARGRGSGTPTPGCTADPTEPRRPSPTPTSRRRRSGSPRCCGRSGPTCSRSTTATAATATPTTCRCTGSARRRGELAGTPVVLEATVPGRLFRAVLRVLRLARPRPGQLGAARHAAGVHDPARDHPPGPGRRVHSRAKRAAMAAHGSQRRADGDVRVLDRLLRLPLPVFALAFGREWFVEQGRSPGGRTGDVFATLRGQ